MPTGPGQSDESLAAALQEALGHPVGDIDLETLLDRMHAGEIGGNVPQAAAAVETAQPAVSPTAPPVAPAQDEPAADQPEPEQPRVIRLANGNRVRANTASPGASQEKVEHFALLYGISEPLARLVAEGKMGAKTAKGLQHRMRTAGKPQPAESPGFDREKMRPIVLGAIAVVLLLILLAL